MMLLDFAFRMFASATVLAFIVGVINSLFRTDFGLWINFQTIEMSLDLAGTVMVTWPLAIITVILYTILTGRQFFVPLKGRVLVLLILFILALSGVTYIAVKSSLDYSMIGKPPSEMTLDEKLVNASMMEEFEDIREFVAAGADVNVLDKDGKTVGMLVIEYNFDSSDEELLEIVKFLVDSGLNLEVKDKSGKTIFDYAEKDAEWESGPLIVEFLESVKSPT